ncbi:stAR-related lipid transfer protein 13-like isoform X2 [Corythoichthys intestinalis]|uniref:stAR-related lipid transfer protein 13-like isoform X2 n=1 Tax=Corythoichthys intestinalis TaxID=161448 RepID=UPI0025A654FA|nr:stAR-related lipid transfer protein 13-like isoform X2 [Corythoichthys intestinalis]
MELLPEAHVERHPPVRLRSDKLAFSAPGASVQSDTDTSRDLTGEHPHAEDRLLKPGHLGQMDNSVGFGLRTETVERRIPQGKEEDPKLRRRPRRNWKDDLLRQGRRPEPVPKGTKGGSVRAELVLGQPQNHGDLRRDPKDLPDGPPRSELELFPKELKDGSLFVRLCDRQDADDLRVPKEQRLLKRVQNLQPLPDVFQNGLKDTSLSSGPNKALPLENGCSLRGDRCPIRDGRLNGLLRCSDLVSDRLRDTSVSSGPNKAQLLENLCSQKGPRGDRCDSRPICDSRLDGLPEVLRCLESLPKGLRESSELTCINNTEGLRSDELGRRNTTQGFVRGLLPHDLEEDRCRSRSDTWGFHADVADSSLQRRGHVSDAPQVRTFRSLPHHQRGSHPIAYRRAEPFLSQSKCRSQSGRSVRLNEDRDLSADGVDFEQLSNGPTAEDSSPARRHRRGSVRPPRVVKREPSSVAFSDRVERRALVDGGSDDDESSRDGDHDAFPERSANPGRGKDEGRRYGANDATCGDRARASGTKEESSPLPSPWSESVSRLMRKPDRLYLDIEEAPSGGSSPSDTPCAARKKQICNKMSGEARTEVEAKEACDWLRAAGFPQYAQLFEESQFPIDIRPVKRDHDFLDKDLVEPLCRRLNTLNKCASLKLDVNLPKKKSEDSDEEDLFAISDKWTFEWSSRRWSRLQDIDRLLGNRGSDPSAGDDPPLRTATSSESVLTDLSEPEVSSEGSGPRGLSAEDSDGSDRTRWDSVVMPDSTSLTMSHFPHYGSLPRKHAKTSRTRAKDFLKRMETLRSRGAVTRGRKTLVISAPVVQREVRALKTIPCAEIINGDGGTPEPPSRKVPSQSGSEGSGHSSGSAGSTPNLKDRKAYRADHKRSGMYLEDVDVLSGDRVAEHNRLNEFCSYEDLLVHIPNDHKPGTFPKALSIESLSPTNGAPIDWHAGSVHLDTMLISCRQESESVTQRCSRGSRISVYDNVPGSHLYASTGDLIDLEKEDLFPHLDDILMHVSGLQQIVDRWSKNVLPGGRGVSWSDGTRERTAQIALDLEADSATESRTRPSAGDGVSLWDVEATGLGERRDSGVGASLTRPSRLRWPSFQISDRLSRSVASLQITNQSAGQLSLLQKFSLLRLTAIMEKYSLSNKHGWTWAVPKFMKRMKVPDYKDKNVFGVPLIVHVQRSGQPLPLGLQQALRYLRSQCLDQVGLFRKSGVKSRIQALRQMNESAPDNVNYDDQSAYDVADMVKQFFRDLPEPLLTSKLGETFLHIYQYVPKDQRFQAVQAAIMLMSDENREVLQTLLCFLSDVTSSVEENQMTPTNIAVCLAPSLFHLNILKKDNLSPRAIQKKYASGRPDQKDLNETLAATQGLAHMITECNRLFEIPHEMVTQSRNSYVEADLHAPAFEELYKQLEDDDETHRNHMEGQLENLLKEAREKSKYWVSCGSSDNTELYYKKVGDGNPLKRWRTSVEVEAPPSVVLNRVLRERHMWDVDLLQWKVCETLDKQTEVFQYVLNRMPPHPSRDFVVLRSWRTDLPKGACSLVSVSVEHEDCPPVGVVRAIVLESNYLLEPCGSGKSRLTHICRVDLKGRTPDWYNKAFGHLCAAEAARIRNSFQPLITDGPETKI